MESLYSSKSGEQKLEALYVSPHLNFIFQYCHVAKWAIQQRLIRMQLLAKSLTGEEIARELLFVLQAQYGIATGSLVATMWDRASVNNLAMSILRVMYPHVLDVECFSHTIDNAGHNFAPPVIDEVGSSWVWLFSHSPKHVLVLLCKHCREDYTTSTPSLHLFYTWHPLAGYVTCMRLLGKVLCSKNLGMGLLA